MEQLSVLIYRPFTLSTGVGSMGEPGAGAPMKFPSGIYIKSHFALNCFLCYRFSVQS